jgi:hypothetical protein
MWISRFLFACLLLAVGNATAQSYQVISVQNGGTIRGTVKWSGPVPRTLTLPITKDPAICDPESAKTRDLERLVIGPGAGVANTVVFIKYISAGKPMDLPEVRRFLDQKHCRYIPHILLVPEKVPVQMKSSDATLHTIHMTGAATYNLPFPSVSQAISRTMPTRGLINLQCNGGHSWMNGTMFVVSHPYYAVTDESGKFELADVPPGDYQIVAWHEGWHLTGKENTLDVLSQQPIMRPVFSEPQTWEKRVTVLGNDTHQIDFILSEK